MKKEAGTARPRERTLSRHVLGKGCCCQGVQLAPAALDSSVSLLFSWWLCFPCLLVPRPICWSVSLLISATPPTCTHTYTRPVPTTPFPVSWCWPFHLLPRGFEMSLQEVLVAEAAAAEPCGFDKPHLIGRKPGEFERTETSTKLLLSGII